MSLGGQVKKRTRKRSPYRKTPARLAASLANLERARAAPKGLVYRPTVKACGPALPDGPRTTLTRRPLPFWVQKRRQTKVRMPCL